MLCGDFFFLFHVRSVVRSVQTSNQCENECGIFNLVWLSYVSDAANCHATWFNAKIRLLSYTMQPKKNMSEICFFFCTTFFVKSTAIFMVNSKA